MSVPINKTYSTIGAYEHLFMDPTLGPKRSILQQCNLNDYIEANLVYDKDRSETEMNDMLSLIPQASGMVMEGQRIIDRGDIVDAKTYRVLNSFEQAMEKRNATKAEITSTLIGQTIYVTHPDRFVYTLFSTFPQGLLRQTTFYISPLCNDCHLPYPDIINDGAQYPKRLHTSVHHGTYLLPGVHGLPNGFYWPCYNGTHQCRSREIPI